MVVGDGCSVGIGGVVGDDGIVLVSAVLLVSVKVFADCGGVDLICHIICIFSLCLR